MAVDTIEGNTLDALRRGGTPANILASLETLTRRRDRIGNDRGVGAVVTLARRCAPGSRPCHSPPGVFPDTLDGPAGGLTGTIG
jgi:hypothetical protein